MTGLRTTFSAILLTTLWLLPQAARAADVTVDYSQLDSAANEYMPPADIAVENSFVKEPIHLHPLVAINSPTVKNLAAEDMREAIHLHPPAPKVLAAAPVLHEAASSAVPPNITQIDLAMAAVPAAPRATTPTQTETASIAPPVETPEPNEPPPVKTDIALDNVVIPAKPKPAEATAPAPATLESTLSDAAPAPVTPIVPTKSDDDAPTGFTRVNAVTSKTDDLTPEDVVGLDLGTPQKQTDN